MFLPVLMNCKEACSNCCTSSNLRIYRPSNLLSGYYKPGDALPLSLFGARNVLLAKKRNLDSNYIQLLSKINSLVDRKIPRMLHKVVVLDSVNQNLNQNHTTGVGRKAVSSTKTVTFGIESQSDQ